jgi:hypothetical protein
VVQRLDTAATMATVQAVTMVREEDTAIRRGTGMVLGEDTGMDTTGTAARAAA